jgi:Fe-S cluster assembly protein SufD
VTVATFADDLELVAADGPAWLAPVRERALGRFRALGFPTTRDEDWKYTSTAPISEADWLLLREPGGEVTREDVDALALDASWTTLVFVNGRYAPELSRTGGLADGLRVADLASVLRGDAGPELARLAETHLAKVAGFERQAFTALNTALMSDGAVVYAAKDADVRGPVHLVFVSDAAAARGVTHPRNLVVAERNSRLTVVETYAALGDATYFTNAVTEAVVADGATLRHYKVQRESARAFHVGTIDVRQARDSHYVSFSFAVGARLARTNVYTSLAGAGGGATLNGLYLLDGEQHTDHQTRIHHVEPSCYSRELYKGILGGTSHGVFNGKVYVEPAAQKTDGKQENHTLLLSDRAHVDTKPQLEIFADDVKCTHGATVGRIDEAALFYMKSRGVGRELARNLLTYAFAADVIETIEVDAVREGLEQLVLSRFVSDAGGDVPHRNG